MPIRPELKYFYPIDWPQVSHWVRFVRAKGRCQACGRPHGTIVRHLGDGRWWDEQLCRPGATGEAARSPRLPWPTMMRRCARPRSRWLRLISTMIPPIADTNIATKAFC
jgi:hypothetical protein